MFLIYFGHMAYIDVILMGFKAISRFKLTNALKALC